MNHDAQNPPPHVPPQAVAWHQLGVAETAARLGSDPRRGLDPAEVASRRAQYGPNELQRRSGPSPWLLLGRQFTEPLILLLIVAAVIAGVFTHEITDSIVIGVIVVLSALLGFSQERRAQQALAALRRMAEPVARVLREGAPLEIPAREVVPGDLLALEAGMRVVADARVVEAANLQADEAALTGEAYPVDKDPQPVAGEHVPLGDRRCMVYSGTVLTRGRGLGLVTGTGMSTELGKIAELLQETPEAATPLQQRLHHVGKVLAGVALAVCALVVVAGLLRHHSLREMFLTAVALAVAAVPEGLPAVITIALALGAREMVKRNALIRRLPAVETLGSVTVICTDKTGTLTEGAMRPAWLYTLDGEHELHKGRWEPAAASATAQRLLAALALCNDAHLPMHGEGHPNYADALGDPTEVALLGAALAGGLPAAEVRAEYPRVGEIPFDSERKRMTTVNRAPDLGGGPLLAVVKGAPDQVFPQCSHYLHGGQVLPLTEETRQVVHERNVALSARGLRLLAAACKPLAELPAELEPEALESGLTFLGLVALVDPPRPEAAAAIERARQAGLRTVMVTGDYAATAAAIAEQVGLTRAGDQVLEGQDLEDLTVEQLSERVEGIGVYARVAPADKVKVVEAWRRRGAIVAVTGDGVNDAAALQRAEIGVAMGQTGTEVAKDAADMVLLDDNYATIVAAIEQGRVIYDNLRKFIRYLLGTNVGEIFTLFFGIALGWPVALLPVQILWVNLVTDGLPALALGFEPAEEDVMRRPPRPPRESLFARGMGYNILWTGLVMAAATLGCFYWRALQEHPGLGWFNWFGLLKDDALAGPRTLAFFVLAGLQMANVLSVRMERQLVFGRAFFSNPRLLAAVAITLAGQLAVTYLPPLQKIFRTQALTGPELALALAVCVGFFLLSEFVNWLEIRRDRQRAKA